MRSVKINKIAAIGLLMVLVIGLAYASQGEILANRREASTSLNVSNVPKVGEVFTASYAFTLRVLPESVNTYPHKILFIVNTSPEKDAYKIVSGKLENQLPELKKGAPAVFNISLIITKPVKRIQIIGGIPGHIAWARAHQFYLLNPETGQYGTKEEYDKQLRQKAEWWYDPAGEFTGDPVHPDCAKKNGEIIAKMQEINSNLTDWEALYLHYDGIQALMGGMGTQETTDEERWRFLLEMGWIGKQRANKQIKERWLKELIEEYKGKPLTKEQGLNPQFFIIAFSIISNGILS